MLLAVGIGPAYAVRHEQDGDGQLELVTHEAKVLLEAEQTAITDVDCVC